MTKRDRLAQLELRILHEGEQLPLDARKFGPLFHSWGLAASPQECFWVVAFDAMLTVRTVIEISRGDSRSVDLNLPSMLSAVLTTGCVRFILVHNHPSDDPRPSVADFQATRDAMEAANACGLYLEEHLIVTPSGKSYSFVESGFLVPADFGAVAAGT